MYAAEIVGHRIVLIFLPLSIVMSIYQMHVYCILVHHMEIFITASD